MKSESILTRIYNLIETHIEVLQDLYDAAENAREYGLSGYIQERLTTHQKFCWQLRSILEE